MKKYSVKKIMLLLLFCLFFGAAAQVTVGRAVPVMAAKKQTVKAVPRNGWYTFPSGNKRYYRKGKYLKGLQKIRKNTYYFNNKGLLQRKNVKVGNKVYYLNEKGILQAKKIGKSYFYANGKRMSRLDAQDFETLQMAEKIVSQITTSGMSDSQKLQTCFAWVMRKPYLTMRTFSNFAGWPAVYAQDHFVRGGGNCMADAAAFAYLARAVGYKNVYVCVDCDGSGGRGHAWTEINGLVYDPLFAQSKSYAANYGVRYGVYPLHAILHIAV